MTNAERFLAKSPSLIMTLQGWGFYEHPERGDEHPLVAVSPDGRLLRTPFWDADSPSELLEWVEEHGHA